MQQATGQRQHASLPGAPPPHTNGNSCNGYYSNSSCYACTFLLKEEEEEEEEEEGDIRCVGELIVSKYVAESINT